MRFFVDYFGFLRSQKIRRKKDICEIIGEISAFAPLSINKGKWWLRHPSKIDQTFINGSLMRIERSYSLEIVIVDLVCNVMNVHRHVMPLLHNQLRNSVCPLNHTTDRCHSRAVRLHESWIGHQPKILAISELFTILDLTLWLNKHRYITKHEKSPWFSVALWWHVIGVEPKKSQGKRCKSAHVI